MVIFSLIFRRTAQHLDHTGSAIRPVVGAGRGFSDGGRTGMTSKAQARTNPATQARSGIVWLASYPKSGNTWARALIHNLLGVMAGEDRGQDINAMDRFTAWEISKPLYTAALGYEPTDQHRREIATVRHRVQQQIADAHEGVIFAKTHHALVMDRGHSTINFAVTAGAVYILRNPLDVAISYAHYMNRTIDQVIGAMGTENVESDLGPLSVYEVHGSWSQHVVSWTGKPHPAIYVMRYEDMQSDPERVVTGLACHLQLAASSLQIAEAIDRSSFERLREQERAEGFREKPDPAGRFFREGRAGQWKDVLSAAQIDRIVGDHREQMVRFGYWPR
jgi:hypothetical protein